VRRYVTRRPCAADAATALPSIAAPPPRCLRCSQRCRLAFAAAAVLPLPPLCRRCCCRPVTLRPGCSPSLSCRHCHHRCRCATLLPLRWQRLCCTARRRCATAVLPLLLCQCCYCAPAANTALQMLSLHCLLLPHCCHAASANAATALLTPPLHCQRRRRAAAATTTLPLPAAPLPATAELPPPLPPPPMCCCHLPRTPNAAAALPAIAVPLLRCLGRSADVPSCLGWRLAMR
jgi:hypothetical protein